MGLFDDLQEGRETQQLQENAVINEMLLPEIVPDLYPQCSLDETHFISQANQLIQAFNSASLPEEQLDALYSLEQVTHEYENDCRPSDLVDMAAFNQIKNELFEQIKVRYASQPINNLLANKDNSPTTDILSNMSQTKTDALLSILIKGDNLALQNDLEALYKPDDHSREAVDFRNFIKLNKIEFLGGSNSQNFTVTNHRTDKVKILKVDGRLNMPQRLAKYFRGKVKNLFTPIEYDRQAQAVDPKTGELVSRTLVVTEYRLNGDLTAHSGNSLDLDEQQPIVTYDTTHKNAEKMMSQMAQQLINIQDNNGFLPDAKLSNWLVNDEGDIEMADDKSFLYQSNNIYSPGAIENKDTKLLSSDRFRPLEFDLGAVEVEPFHAYILGKNLYAYLVCDYPP